VLYECSACDGIWVDADVFERLCADRASQAAVLPRLVRPQPTKAAAPVRYRPCMRCRKMMNRINFGALSGAVVDVCKGHGTFLDPGELHQIVTFLQGGGLERARARRMEELRDEERRLRELEARASRNAARSSTSEHWHVDGGDIVSLIDLITGH
jgi:Zn-finger nucleic acid-binding protein